MDSENRLTEQERANFVAYLDGELTPSETQALERKLQADPKSRRELENFRRTWDLLGVLEKPVPTESFTQKTLQMATGRDRISLKSQKPLYIQNWFLVASWVVGLVFCFAIGFRVAIVLTK